MLDSIVNGGERGAGAFIFESVGLGTYRTIERSSVPRLVDLGGRL